MQDQLQQKDSLVADVQAESVRLRTHMSDSIVRLEEEAGHQAQVSAWLTGCCLPGTHRQCNHCIYYYVTYAYGHAVSCSVHFYQVTHKDKSQYSVSCLRHLQHCSLRCDGLLYMQVHSCSRCSVFHLHHCSELCDKMTLIAQGFSRPSHTHHTTCFSRRREACCCCRSLQQQRLQ